MLRRLSSLAERAAVMTQGEIDAGGFGEPIFGLDR
jgi:hypothetical protein